MPMQVARILKRSPVTIAETASIRDAIRSLAEEGIGALVVVESGTPIGIVTERDVVCALADNPDLEETLRDVVVLEPYTIDLHASVAAAATLMREKSIRHLLVTDDGSLQGVISIRDLVEALLEERGETTQELLEVIRPLVMEPAVTAAGSDDSPADGG